MSTIIYLDDDDDDLFLFKKAIREMGSAHNVICVSEATELFEVLEQNTPDIILLDYNMPGKNGIDCLKEIRKKVDWNRITIIMYSTFFNYNLVSVSYQEKANLYIQKPHDYEETVSILKDVLSSNFDRHRLPLPDSNNDNYMKDAFPGRDDLYRLK